MAVMSPMEPGQGADRRDVETDRSVTPHNGEASPPPEGSFPIATVLDLRVLKAAGSFLGIVGAGGGGFAAFSFGIGYLASSC